VLEQFIKSMGEAAESNDAMDRLARMRRERQTAIEQLQSRRKDSEPSELARIHVLADLVEFGWRLRVQGSSIEGQRPQAIVGEHERVRRKTAMLARRDEQLREPSVRDFVERAEQVRFSSSSPTSVFSLMRDGRDLAKSLRQRVEKGSLEGAIEPYVQVVSPGATCEHTGMKLGDIWRYFRHTWAQPYGSVPGRVMQILVRDAAAPYHPVIGIAALGSAAAQLAVRDKHIGWDDESMFQRLVTMPSSRRSKWIRDSIVHCLDEIYTDDFVIDGLMPSQTATGDDLDAIVCRLKSEAVDARTEHKTDRDEHARRVKAATLEESWLVEAETPLFRSKRAKELASLLHVRQELGKWEMLGGKHSAEEWLGDRGVRKALSNLFKRVRARVLGTGIADLIICGAIPPYGPLVAGKLVALLSISPEVVDEFRARYLESASVIASSMAGRPIIRSSHLAYVSTTSLYGVRPCQYDRARVPAEHIGGRHGERFGFSLVSDTRGFGSMQFGKRTYEAIRTSELLLNGSQNVHHRFGEGASPRMRGLRDGLAALEMGSAELLQHEQRRNLYGAPLVTDPGGYLMGFSSKPEYLLDQRKTKAASTSLVDWWLERWVRPRLEREDVLDRIEQDDLVHPIRHRARVMLPPLDDNQIPLFY
jgi:hypothetical protein